MTLEGIVRNGVIVPMNGALLPEGTRVQITIEQNQTLPEGTRVSGTVEADPGQEESLRDVLMKFAGCMTGLPPDMAEQHDHYIHGTPKR
jgi:hypothetical protein